MPNRDIEKEIREKVVSILDHAKKKRTGQPKTKEEKGVKMVAVGKNVFQAGRDIIQTTKPPSRRVIIQPGPQHISEEVAFRLHELVDEAVKIEVMAGQTRQQAYSNWFGMLKNRYRVTQYKLIPAEMGEDAIDWLRTQIAVKLQPKLRRRDNQAWRNRRYSAIFARADELNYGEEWVYAKASEVLGEQVTSLKKLGERKLDKVYRAIISIKA